MAHQARCTESTPPTYYSTNILHRSQNIKSHTNPPESRCPHFTKHPHNAHHNSKNTFAPNERHPTNAQPPTEQPFVDNAPRVPRARTQPGRREARTAPAHRSAMVPPALRRAGTAMARPEIPRSAPSRGQPMRKARELRTRGARAAAGAAMSAIDRIVPTAGIATVTDARMRPRMTSS